MLYIFKLLNHDSYSQANEFVHKTYNNVNLNLILTVNPTFGIKLNSFSK